MDHNSSLLEFCLQIYVMKKEQNILNYFMKPEACQNAQAVISQVCISFNSAVVAKSVRRSFQVWNEIELIWKNK